MRRSYGLPVVVLLGLLWMASAGFAASPAFWPTVRSSSGTSVSVARGILYSHYILETSAGPLSIHHLKLDLRNPAVRLTVALARNQLISGDETVSSMVRRTGAIAGVNADFFDIGDSGMPLNIMVQDGQLLRSPAGWVAMAIGKEGDARIVRYRWLGHVLFPSTGVTYWLAGLNTGLVPDGIVAMSNVRGYGAPVPGPGIHQTVVELIAPPPPDPSAKSSDAVRKANAMPAPSGAPTSTGAPAPSGAPAADTPSASEAAPSAGTPPTTDAPPAASTDRAPSGGTPPSPDAGPPSDAGDSAGTAPSTGAAAPPGSTPAANPTSAPPPPPAPRAGAAPGSTATADFTVRAVWPQQAYYAPFPNNALLLVGRGRAAEWLRRNVAPGMAVQLHLTTDPDWRAATHIIGGGPLLVENGRLAFDPLSPVPNERHHRNPVTAVGISQDGGTMLLVTVDGRQPRLSIGLTQPQLAAYMRWLGAYQAMAFDSGGSVTMIVRFPWRRGPAVVNSPSDGHERPVGNALLVMSNTLDAQQAPSH